MNGFPGVELRCKSVMCPSGHSRQQQTATGNGPNASWWVPQQASAYAAGAQGKGWTYIELFYHDQGEENSGYVSERFLQELAQVVPGLSLSQWSTDRNDSSLASQVATDAQAANNAGFNGTPSFLIGKTGGALSKLSEVSVTSPAPYNEVIEKLLKS